MDLNWDELTSIRHDRRAEKDGQGVSFAAYTPTCACGEPTCPRDGHRLDANVLEVTALGLDLDKRLLPDGSQADIDPAAAQAAVERLMSLGVRAWVYSTHSATPAKPSLRAIIALSRPVARADWRRFWRAAIAHLGIFVQTTCQNEARFWYLPSAPDGAEVVNVSLPGEPLDVDALLSAAPAAPEKPSEKPLETVDGDPRTLERLADALRKHGPAVDGQEGDSHTYRAACICRDHGFDEDRAFDLLDEWNATCQPPWESAELARKVAHAYRYATGAPGSTLLDYAVLDAVATDPLASLTSAVTAGLHLRLEDAAQRERPPIRTYPTGIDDLDRLLGGGLSTRQLAVLGAPPGDGKSALAVTLSLRLEATLPVLYVSTELESEELVARVAAQILGVAWRDIVRGKVDGARVREALAGKRIWAIGCDVLPRGDDALRAVIASAQAIAEAEGIAPLLIVDYMQDLARGGDEKSLRSRVGEIATMLRAMSQVLDCPLLAVCSVSRSYYGKQKADAARQTDDATAYLAAMKESGDVDYAAATVLFLDVAEPVDGSRLARIAVAKSRHGEVGFAGARFHGATGRWEGSTLAAVALAPAERAKSLQASQDANLEKAVLEFVRARPRGMVNLRALRAGVEPHSAKVDHAAQRLVDAGTLEELPGANRSRIFVLAIPA